MRLLTKTTLYYITVSLFIFFLGAIGIYQLVKNLEDKKVRQELSDQMIRFSNDLKNIDSEVQNMTIISGGLIQLEHVHQIGKPEIVFSDTLIYDNIRKQLAPYKKLSFYTEIRDVLYKTTIYKSLIESNYLIEQVALIVTIIVIVFLLCVYFLYRYFFGRIWADFFDTITKIQNFDINSPEKLNFPQSMIIEFNELNQVLDKMIGKINTDFQGLKDLSGNLTHEIQTPLAVIKSKADLLLQDEQVSEKQMQIAGEIGKETIRVSRIIKTLSLFSKLDHKQFIEIQDIDIEIIINKKLDFFEDFIDAKQLKIETEIQDGATVKMNPELADVLFNNLIKNAIRHNIENGFVEINMQGGAFSIKNSGTELKTEPGKLFERYAKASQKSESLGIGLSIVKKICDYYGFLVEYKCIDSIHNIKLIFNK